MTIAPTILCIICVIGLLYAEATGWGRLKVTAKTLASLSFIVVGVAAGLGETALGLWMLAGLVLCAVGDVFLLSRAAPFFLSGMAAFAAGHIAYSVNFALRGFSFDMISIVTAMAMAAVGAGVLSSLWSRLGDMRWPVTGYILIISVMVVLGVSVGTGVNAPLTIAIGAVAFAVSDIAVARDQFLASQFLNKLWGLPLYYGAQLTLAHSV